MKISKLNARGFSHDILLVAIVVLFAIGGTGAIVASHADSLCPDSGSPVVGASGAQMPSGNGRYPLNQYWSPSLRDHYYTLVRDDPAFEAFGYCYQGTLGWAYSQPASGTLPLVEYFSGSLHKHFFTLYPTLEPGPTCASCGYNQESITAYLAPAGTYGSVNYTEPIYRYSNPDTGGHYFSLTTDGPNKGYPNSEGIAAYAWSYQTDPTGQTPPVPVKTGPEPKSVSGTVSGGTSNPKGTSPSAPTKGVDRSTGAATSSGSTPAAGGALKIAKINPADNNSIQKVVNSKHSFGFTLICDIKNLPIIKMFNRKSAIACKEQSTSQAISLPGISSKPGK